jgi:hypothetical protein
MKFQVLALILSAAMGVFAAPTTIPAEDAKLVKDAVRFPGPSGRNERSEMEAG